MNRSSQLLLLLHFIMLLPAPAVSATYFISPQGSDTTGDGSIGRPWATISRSIRAVRAGDTVYLRGGDYPITAWVYFNGASGTEAAPITYAAYARETPRIVYDRRVGVANPVQAKMLYIGTSYYVFDGLALYQTPESREAILALKQRTDGMALSGSHISIRNCSFDNVLGLGIAVSGSNALVERSRLTRIGNHGFYIRNTAGTFRDNYVSGGRSAKIIAFQIQYASAVGNRIYGNTIVGEVAAGGWSGVVFSGPVRNNEVFNNIFIDTGVRAPGKSGSVVWFWDETGAPPGAGNKFYNNTVVGATPNSGIIGTVHGMNVEIFNNIFRMDAPSLTGGAPGYHIHDNLFFNASGVPSGNVTADPLLANPRSGTAEGFRLRAGSPAIDAAVSGAPAVDFFGVPRLTGRGPDLGAIEYLPGMALRPAAPASLRVR